MNNNKYIDKKTLSQNTSTKYLMYLSSVSFASHACISKYTLFISVEFPKAQNRYKSRKQNPPKAARSSCVLHKPRPYYSRIFSTMQSIKIFQFATPWFQVSTPLITPRYVRNYDSRIFLSVALDSVAIECSRERFFFWPHISASVVFSVR